MLVSQTPVLVLNKLWSPIGTRTLETAMGKLLGTYKNGEPKAKVIDPNQEFQTYTWADWAAMAPRDGESVIRTRSQTFRIPEIILLTRYDKFPDCQVNFSRRMIFKRDNFQCQYCGIKPGTKELTLDHILPRSRGGTSCWANVCLSCILCNSRKAAKTPEEAGMAIQGWLNPEKRKMPCKPKFNLFRGEHKTIPKSWQSFVDTCYWETTLEP